VRSECRARRRGGLLVTDAFRLSGQCALGHRNVLRVAAHAAEWRLHAKSAVAGFEQMCVQKCFFVLDPYPRSDHENQRRSHQGRPMRAHDAGANQHAEHASVDRVSDIPVWPFGDEAMTLHHPGGSADGEKDDEVGQCLQPKPVESERLVLSFERGPGVAGTLATHRKNDKEQEPTDPEQPRDQYGEDCACHW
jgi:hypothetical protein